MKLIDRVQLLILNFLIGILVRIRIPLEVRKTSIVMRNIKPEPIPDFLLDHPVIQLHVTKKKSVKSNTREKSPKKKREK